LSGDENAVINFKYFLHVGHIPCFENLKIAPDGVDLEWPPTLALRRLRVQNMEDASSPNGGASHIIFDLVLDPDKSESEKQLGSTRDRATSDHLHESKENIDPILKPLDLGPRGKAFRFSGEWSISSNDFESGACQAQDFQEHVQKRLIITNPFPSSITYITFSFRICDVLRALHHRPSDPQKARFPFSVIFRVQQQYERVLFKKKWMFGELSWKIMVGGLCGSEEFNREILDPLPGWTRVVALGELRLSNSGRLKVFV
jgi:hypothetical protein